MISKTHIIDDLGETGLLLPARLEQALIANEQAKFLFTLLQSAQTRADHPELEIDCLVKDRERAGIEDSSLDDIVSGAGRSETYYLIPRFDEVRRDLFEQVAAMIEPLRLAAASADDSGRRTLSEVEARYAALDQLIPGGDRIDAAAISSLTRGRRDDGDSLHLLVMDLHKQLNRLQAQLAEDDVDGASVYRLGEVDRGRVAAFMQGLNRTAPLRFGHPGLGTTATTVDARLMIQNDIGTTDAHVFMVTVEGLKATLLYTDVHLRRLDFFKSLLAPFAVAWQETAAREVEGFENDRYYRLCGVFEAGDDEELARYLEYLGSRLVFLIDWNKARKRLQRLVARKDAIRLLRWAADHDLGHRAFVEIGGEQMIYRAVEYAAQGESHYGQSLGDILGKANAVEFLRYVLRVSAASLLAGRNWQLIEDQVRAELLSHFRSVPEELLAMVARHAEYVFETADLVRTLIMRIGFGDHDDDDRARALARAAGWEREADRIVNKARAIDRRPTSRRQLRELVECQDDAADALEDGVFLVTLLMQHATPLASEIVALLGTLCDETLASTQEFIKMIESARHVHRGGERADVEDFLRAVERVFDYEHRTDETERRITSRIASSDAPYGLLHAAVRLSASLEGTADTLSLCAHRLRNYVVEEVMSA